MTGRAGESTSRVPIGSDAPVVMKGSFPLHGNSADFVIGSKASVSIWFVTTNRSMMSCASHVVLR